MSREDYKHLLLEHLNSMNDVETKLECCKDIQKVLSFKVNEYQNEIEKKKNETSISDELKAYLNKVHFTDNVYRFMIAEGLNGPVLDMGDGWLLGRIFGQKTRKQGKV